MKIITCILLLVVGAALATTVMKKSQSGTGIVDFTKIAECNDFVKNPKKITVDYKKLYDTETKTTKCPNKDIWAYTTDFYKVINCFLRTNMGSKVAIPQYVRNSIDRIRRDLNSAPKGRIYNLKQGEVYRNTFIADTSRIRRGALFKNLSFLSTSTVKGANDGFSKPGSYSLTLRSVRFVGKEISSCSKYANEKEFLVDVGQCWQVTEVQGNRLVLNQVSYKSCAPGTFGDL